jgi:uncharacterized phage protein (TIGR01671 family)
MRDIKFRCVIGGNIFHNEHIMNKSQVGNAFIKTVFNKCESVEDPLDEWEESLIWEQFTGLTDCNGVDIYEGDLFEVFSNSSPVIGEVIYSDGCFMIEYEEINKPTSMMLYWFLRNNDNEIIGNKHQNPKLILKK